MYVRNELKKPTILLQSCRSKGLTLKTSKCSYVLREKDEKRKTDFLGEFFRLKCANKLQMLDQNKTTTSESLNVIYLLSP